MKSVIKAKVIMDGNEQRVVLPEGIRFSTEEVYVEHDPVSGALRFSEQPFRRPVSEILRDMDEAGVANLFLDRELPLNPERDLR